MGLFLLIILGAMGLSLWAQWHVKGVYNYYSQFSTSSGATGADVAAAILDRAGIHDVEIVPIDQMLGDHYDPINKRLVLSSENYHGLSVAAVGVAAHECGHAIQHQQAYAPLQWRMASIGLVNFVSPILMWLPFLVIFHLFPGRMVLMLGSLAMGVIMLFNLITLPVEFDASNRAKEVLRTMGFVGSREEIEGVKKTLDAAGWTYVAAFIVSLGSFLYYFLPLLLGGRRND